MKTIHKSYRPNFRLPHSIILDGRLEYDAHVMSEKEFSLKQCRRQTHSTNQINYLFPFYLCASLSELPPTIRIMASPETKYKQKKVAQISRIFA